MEMRRAGKSGLTLSRLGLGTMTWGRDTDTHEAADQSRAFIEAGGNFFDTSPIYGDGDSERVIGGMIGTLFQRDEVVIATKAGIQLIDGQRVINNSRASLISDLDKSLARLGSDYIDIGRFTIGIPIRLSMTPYPLLIMPIPLARRDMSESPTSPVGNLLAL